MIFLPSCFFFTLGMIAILPTIQAQEKSYHGFLFYENSKNGVMIWKRILNLKNKYHFPLTLNDIPAKKKAIVAVRTEILNSGSNGGIYSKPLHYLSDSSLSQDLGKHGIFYKDIHKTKGGHQYWKITTLIEIRL